MAVKQIYVGNEYKKAFQSIRELIGSGCFNGLPYRAFGDTISDGVYEYVLSNYATDVSREEKHGFGQNGATWFKVLRGESLGNDNAVWVAFIENVIKEYHKRYSVVEFTQGTLSKEEKQAQFSDAEQIMENFIRLFFPEFAGKTTIKDLNDRTEVEDVYGVSMRIELSSGTGASLPVLCKVYFKKDGRIFTPINGSISEQIEQSVSNIVPDELDVDEPIVDNGIIDSTLNALDNLINSEEVNFADYLCFSDESDKEAIGGMLDKMSHDAFELECQAVNVLYITRIKANVANYDVYEAGKPKLRLMLGLNNSISIACLNCNSRHLLVDKNDLTYYVNGRKKTVFLRANMQNFGLTERQIEEIKEYSEFKDHYIKVSCDKLARGGVCEEYKCKSQLFEVEVETGVITKCKDCPYPEVVYTTKNGEQKYTPTLLFASDTLEMMEKKGASGPLVEKCVVCGRTFTVGALKNKRCPLCREVLSCNEDKKARKAYKVYKNLLPLTPRALTVFSKKGCVEDEELIMFAVGKKYFLYSKLNVKEKGKLEKPMRIKGV